MADVGTVLVVGARGLVGSALMECLGDSALGVDREARNTAGVVSIDLRTNGAGFLAMRDVLDAARPKHVVYAAGWSDVDACEDDEKRALRANASIPANLAEEVSNRGGRFVYLSSDYVFDGIAGPYSEEDSARPLSVYGRSKLLGERMVLAADRRALIVRSTGIYGPEYRGKNFVYRLFRQLHAGQHIRVPSDQISTPTYSRDLAKVVKGLLESNAEGIVNVVGMELLSRADFAVAIVQRWNGDTSWIDGCLTANLHQKAKRPLNGGLRLERLSSVVGLNDIHSIAQALQDWQERPAGTALEGW